jgi:hypothetical protein
MPTYSYTTPSENYCAALRQYALQARKRTVETDAALASLLTKNLATWLSSVSEARAAPNEKTPGRVRLSLRSPGASTSTVRYFNSEFLYVMIMHVIHGGRIFMQPNGSKKKHYVRVNIYGGDGKRRPYALRLIADTAKGTYAKEADDYHDLSRAALGKWFVPRDHQDAIAKNGRKEAIDWSISRFNEASKWHFCKTAGEYQKRLAEAYKWLDRLPLKPTRKAQ